MHMPYNSQFCDSLLRLHRASTHSKTSKHGCGHRDRSDSVLMTSHRPAYATHLAPTYFPRRLGLLEALDNSIAVDRTNRFATCMRSAHPIPFAGHPVYGGTLLLPGSSMPLGHPRAR